MSNQFSVAIAHLLAQGHADAALSQFNSLQHLAHERKAAGLGIDFQQYVKHAVPAATSLALALELALKVLYFQSAGKYPKTHNLVDIVASLPQEARDVLATTYQAMYQRDLPMPVTHVAVSFTERAGEHPLAVPPDLSTFDAGLAHASAAYVKWRYLYEHMESPDAAQMHFKALLSLVESAHAAIADHMGDTKVRISSSKDG